MPGGVLVSRIIAATDMAAREAETQVHPLVSRREALLTASPARRHVLNVAQMFATLGE